MSELNILKEWETKAGYKAVLLRNSSFGHICGYVGVPKEHPLYDKSYSSHLDVLLPLYNKAMKGEVGKRGVIPMFCHDGHTASMDIVFNVHGGVTYAGSSKDYPIESELSWIGFDCNHCDDTPENCNEEYCVKECESLAEQIKEVEKTKDIWFTFTDLYKKGFEDGVKSVREGSCEKSKEKVE